MRVLLIDNHDSFTYNLAHDLAVVTGAMPDVVANDAPVAGEVGDWLATYDAIVVSPGPGTPEHETDLGHSAAAVSQSAVPVLGVCLGMQAIGRAAGVGVVRAPRPVHGELTLLAHTGSGLFTGLPNPLPMVRYHSLVLDIPAGQDPAELLVDAWADGLPMAVRHRSRPRWGVQTHPESILSEHGRDLLANFVDLARVWNEAAGRRVGDPLDAPRLDPGERAAPPARTSTVLLRRVSCTAGPDVVFDAVFRGEDHAWLLDSTDGAGFSACGSAAGPLAAVATAVPEGVSLRDARGTRLLHRELVDLVEESLGPVLVNDLDGAGATVADLPFALGWVGYLDYEYACRELGSAVAATEDGAAVLVRADRAVVLRQGVAWVLAQTDDSQAVEAAQRTWVHDTADLLEHLPADDLDLPAPPTVGSVSFRHDHGAYLDLIARCQEQIAAGESYELCLTNQISVTVGAAPGLDAPPPCDGPAGPDPSAAAAVDRDHGERSWSLYRRLRDLAPRPFAAYLAFDGGHVLSASPERFLSVDRDGEVEAKPIKGTRPRGSTPSEDDRLAAELATDVKERAENLMIVDLLRHDLSRVCVPDSVCVPVLFDVESHAGVHQLVSTIRGTLSPGATSLDAVRSALPGGSMTGAPKERSVHLLRELEGGPRGVYSGVVGYISPTGASDWSIVIRTIVYHGDRLSYGVGGAITARSRPEAEWEETLVKARTLGSALGIDIASWVEPNNDASAEDGRAPGDAVAQHDTPPGDDLGQDGTPLLGTAGRNGRALVGVEAQHGPMSRGDVAQDVTPPHGDAVQDARAPGDQEVQHDWAASHGRLQSHGGPRPDDPHASHTHGST